MRQKCILIFAIVLCLSVMAGCSNQNIETDVKEEESVEGSLVKCVEFDGKQMEYIQFGTEGNETLVILPGLSLKSVMGSAEGIVNAYQLLAKKYEIYLFDHIKKEPQGYTISDMADDTLRAFKELGIEHTHLMGVSMGGMVAQTIALKDADKVDSLILCSTTSNVKDMDQSALLNWKKLAEEKDLSSLMASFGEKVYSKDFYEKYKDIIIASGEGTSDLDYANFLTSLSAIRDFDVKDQLKNIKCPIFVLGAGEDRVVGVEASHDIVKETGCKYYIYEGYGHGVYDEAPDYLSRIDEFLDSIK